jgi:hypothetical protein
MIRWKNHRKQEKPAKALKNLEIDGSSYVTNSKKEAESVKTQAV